MTQLQTKMRQEKVLKAPEELTLLTSEYGEGTVRGARLVCVGWLNTLGHTHRIFCDMRNWFFVESSLREMYYPVRSKSIRHFVKAYFAPHV